MCTDVAVEPLLTPLTGEHFRYRTANTDDGARPDVSARGVWTRGSRAFFDLRVFNPLARPIETRPWQLLTKQMKMLRNENTGKEFNT